MHSQIGAGLLVLLGVETEDIKQDAEWLAAKIAQLRIMADENGLMKKDVMETGG